MKIVKLHSTSTEIVYKNSICSMASVIVFATLLLSIVIPFFLVSLLSPNSAIIENRVLYEQPDVKFLHRFVFLAEVGEGDLLACSSFAYLNKVEKEFQKCSRIQYWSEDLNHDLKTDVAHFELDLNSDEEEFQVKNFILILFFQAELKHKCSLSPPAVLIQELDLPKKSSRNGEVLLKTRLTLAQNYEFHCPFFGRNIKTPFQSEIITQNASSMAAFDLELIRKQMKRNAAHFEHETTEKYFKSTPQGGLHIHFSLEVGEIPARYRLSAWERLGQFWLYFASFFGISFYIMNKMKDFLFGRHILRSWEIIPWKKLY